jgi:hypothetical protein
MADRRRCARFEFGPHLRAACGHSHRPRAPHTKIAAARGRRPLASLIGRVGLPEDAPDVG